MAELPQYEPDEFIEESGASTGDARENDPRDAGYADEHDRIFRSHFERVNRLADMSYEQVRPVYELGLEAGRAAGGRAFEEVEHELEHGWLSVRVAGGDWASVRELARVGFERGRQGRVDAMPTAGTTPSHDRPSFSDPVPENMDPTSPESPEQTLSFQHESGPGAWVPHDLTTTDPYAPPEATDSPTDMEH